MCSGIFVPSTAPVVSEGTLLRNIFFRRHDVNFGGGAFPLVLRQLHERQSGTTRPAAQWEALLVLEYSRVSR